jgi:hypothetical protein
MQGLVMIVRYHHAEIILGAQRAHLVFNDRRQLELLQADAGIIMQRLHAGVGDCRRPTEPFKFEFAFPPRHVFHYILSVDGRLIQRPYQLIVEIDVHRLPANQSSLPMVTSRFHKSFTG